MGRARQEGAAGDGSRGRSIGVAQIGRAPISSYFGAVCGGAVGTTISPPPPNMMYRLIAMRAAAAMMMRFFRSISRHSPVAGADRSPAHIGWPPQSTSTSSA